MVYVITKEEGIMEAMSIAEARANFSSVVKGTSSGGEPVIIHSRGKPKVVIMDVAEYREIMATLEEMNDPEARALLEKGEEDIKKGRTKTVEEIFGEAIL